MLRQAEARGAIELDQCSWKLDSSTAMTSKGSGCRTASRSGVPTLPALVARSPAARRIEVSICTVVVLPLVPVTVSQGAAPSCARIRQASSTSPHTGTPASAAATSSGWSGRHPGEVTTRSTGGRGQRGDGVVAVREAGAEDVEDARPLGHERAVGGLPAVDDEDVDAPLEQRVGGREAADPEAGDDGAQAGPVGVAVGEPREPVGRLGHAAPTTHSA